MHTYRYMCICLLVYVTPSPLGRACTDQATEVAGGAEEGGEEGGAEEEEEATIWERQAWCVCVSIWGGPWLLDGCEVRCRGGSAVDCSVFGGAWLRRCSLGGLSGQPLPLDPKPYTLSAKR